MKLEAQDGYYYTDGEVYAKVVYLGCNDTEDRWYLIKEEDMPEEEDNFPKEN